MPKPPNPYPRTPKPASCGLFCLPVLTLLDWAFSFGNITMLGFTRIHPCTSSSGGRSNAGAAGNLTLLESAGVILAPVLRVGVATLRIREHPQCIDTCTSSSGGRSNLTNVMLLKFGVIMLYRTTPKLLILKHCYMLQCYRACEAVHQVRASQQAQFAPPSRLFWSRSLFFSQ